MIITGDDKEEISELIKKWVFDMKDLGRPNYFLGIDILGLHQGIFIYQRKYILDLLVDTEMIDRKPAETLIMAKYGL